MGLIETLLRGFAPMDGPLTPKTPSQEYWLNRQRMAASSIRSAPDIQARSINPDHLYPDWDTQVMAALGISGRPWRFPSINEALGVPAIFRAVALIANSTGSLGVEAFRDGRLLPDSETPKVVRRPDPFRIPRDFYRDTAFDLATRGEFWWWIAKRDTDGHALSLIRIPPWEMKVEETNDRLRPRYLWKDRPMDRDDIRHGTFFLDDTGYRGVGPLQLCGAAMSVAVESQEWAANFFTEDGGYPSLVIKSAQLLGEDPETGVNEADTLRDQWMSKPHNTPRVIDPGIESVEEFGANASSQAMLEARNYTNGDAARMYGIPGELLEYATEGSSLTYQNISEVFTRFVKSPLGPDYLEPIEQHLSDLLPRSTVARFNVKGFQRADIKTRWEVYQLAVEVLGQEEAANLARIGEGMTPGDVEFAPVPFSPPQAIPDRLPITRSAPAEIRCDGRRIRSGVWQACDKLLAADWRGKCPRCKKEYGQAA